MSKFKVGDKVVPVKDHGPLEMGKTYAVSRLSGTLIDDPGRILVSLCEFTGIYNRWFAYRFRHAQKSVLEDEEYKSLFI